MKNTLLAVAVAALFAVIGCGDKGTSGGAGKDKDKEKKDKETVGEKIKAKLTQPEDTFKLTVPSVKVKQGESKEAKITIKRGNNFGDDVALSFDKLPEGVTIEPAAPTLKKSDNDVTITVKAADTAAVNTFEVMVAGKPTTGEASSNKLKLTVEKKK